MQLPFDSTHLNKVISIQDFFNITDIKGFSLGIMASKSGTSYFTNFINEENDLYKSSNAATVFASTIGASVGWMSDKFQPIPDCAMSVRFSDKIFIIHSSKIFAGNLSLVYY